MHQHRLTNSNPYSVLNNLYRKRSYGVAIGFYNPGLQPGERNLMGSYGVAIGFYNPGLQPGERNLMGSYGVAIGFYNPGLQPDV